MLAEIRNPAKFKKALPWKTRQSFFKVLFLLDLARSCLVSSSCESFANFLSHR